MLLTIDVPSISKFDNEFAILFLYIKMFFYDVYVKINKYHKLLYVYIRLYTFICQYTNKTQSNHIKLYKKWELTRQKMR
jgi:hypothetical protein